MATEYSVIWRRSADDDWTEHHEKGMSLARCREVVAMFEQRQWRILRRDSPHSATTHVVARGGSVAGVR